MSKMPTSTSTASGTPSETELIVLMSTLMAKFDRVRLVIDGVNECKEIRKLVRILGDLLGNEDLRHGILVTSRQSALLEHSLAPLSPLHLYVQDYTKDNLWDYVTREIDHKADEVAFLRGKLRGRVIKAITDQSAGM